MAWRRTDTRPSRPMLPTSRPIRAVRHDDLFIWSVLGAYVPNRSWVTTLMWKASGKRATWNEDTGDMERAQEQTMFMPSGSILWVTGRMGNLYTMSLNNFTDNDSRLRCAPTAEDEMQWMFHSINLDLRWAIYRL